MKTACEKILVKAVLPSLWKNKNFGHPTTALSRELTNTGTGIRWVVRNNDRLQVSEINGVPSKLQHIQIGDSKAVIMMDFEVGVISSVHMAKTINFTKLGLLEMASVEHGVNNWLLEKVEQKFGEGAPLNELKLIRFANSIGLMPTIEWNVHFGTANVLATSRLWTLGKDMVDFSYKRDPNKSATLNRQNEDIFIQWAATL